MKRRRRRNPQDEELQRRRRGGDDPVRLAVALERAEGFPARLLNAQIGQGIAYANSLDANVLLFPDARLRRLGKQGLLRPEHVVGLARMLLHEAGNTEAVYVWGGPSGGPWREFFGAPVWLEPAPIDAAFVYAYWDGEGLLMDQDPIVRLWFYAWNTAQTESDGQGGYAQGLDDVFDAHSVDMRLVQTERRILERWLVLAEAGEFDGAPKANPVSRGGPGRWKARCRTCSAHARSYWCPGCGNFLCPRCSTERPGGCRFCEHWKKSVERHRDEGMKNPQQDESVRVLEREWKKGGDPTKFVLASFRAGEKVPYEALEATPDAVRSELYQAALSSGVVFPEHMRLLAELGDPAAGPMTEAGPLEGRLVVMSLPPMPAVLLAYAIVRSLMSAPWERTRATQRNNYRYVLDVARDWLADNRNGAFNTAGELVGEKIRGTARAPAPGSPPLATRLARDDFFGGPTSRDTDTYLGQAIDALSFAVYFADLDPSGADSVNAQRYALIAVGLVARALQGHYEVHQGAQGEASWRAAYEDLERVARAALRPWVFAGGPGRWEVK